jgi:hypothetical protein
MIDEPSPTTPLTSVRDLRQSVKLIRLGGEIVEFRQFFGRGDSGGAVIGTIEKRQRYCRDNPRQRCDLMHEARLCLARSIVSSATKRAIDSQQGTHRAEWNVCGPKDALFIRSL